MISPRLVTRPLIVLRARASSASILSMAAVARLFRLLYTFWLIVCCISPHVASRMLSILHVEPACAGM